MPYMENIRNILTNHFRIPYGHYLVNETDWRLLRLVARHRSATLPQYFATN